MSENPNYTWHKYIEQTKDKPPKQLLVDALKFVTSKENALELGPGAFTDVRFLLEQNFNHIETVNIDDTGKDIYNTLPSDKVSFVISSFENYDFKPNTFDLINAQYSLPFNPPNSFEAVFNKIKLALKPQGVFVGQFFGDRDEWNTPNDNRTFHTIEQTRQLLEDLEIIKLEESERDGSTASGVPKHWHVFNIIAKKN